MPVPIAPGTGLYLEQCNFDTYNSKLDRLIREKCEGERGVLDINLFKDQRDAFFQTKILPEICSKEAQEQEFRNWIAYLRKEWNQSSPSSALENALSSEDESGSCNELNED
jgi:hypothetical protein